MLRAHTVRRLEPGMLDRFLEVAVSWASEAAPAARL
jgi:hypothetical protein